MLILVWSFFLVWETSYKTSQSPGQDDTQHAEYIQKQVKKSDLSPKEKSQFERHLLAAGISKAAARKITDSAIKDN